MIPCLTRGLAALAIVLAFMLGSPARSAPPESRPETAPVEQGIHPDWHPTLIIVHPPALKAAADEWAAYRRSKAGGEWEVALHQTDPADSEDARETAIKRVIRLHWQAHQLDEQPPTIDVLLLGDADGPPPVEAASTAPAASRPASPPTPSQTIPTFHFNQTDPDLLASSADASFAADQPYQLVDDADAAPVIPLGRVPARTVDEARAVLRKIREYETSPNDPAGHLRGGFNRVTFVAGEGHFGAFDALFESLFKQMVDRFVPGVFDLSMTYAKPGSIYCPPPSRLAATALARLGEGCLFFNYVGHGHATGLDSLHWMDKRIPILRAGDLAGLPRLADDGVQRPIALLSCCSTGFFDLPEGRRCLAEELLFAPDGPIAVIAASRVSHPYSNTILQAHVTRELLVEHAPTVGELDLRAERDLVNGAMPLDKELDAVAAPIAFAGKWKTPLKENRLMHARMYNLLGDPCTRIPAFPEPIRDLKLEDGRLTGAIAGFKEGVAIVTIETARAEIAHPDRLLPYDPNEAARLEELAAHNYRIANDRLLGRLEVPVTGGSLDCPLGDALPRGAAIIRVVVTGKPASPRTPPPAAIGAIRLQPPATQPGIQPPNSK